MAADDTRLAGARAAGAVFQIVQIHCFFTVLGDSGDTPVQCFFDFRSWTSHLKHVLLRALLEDCLPEMLSKVGVLGERSMESQKKHRAIAPAALGGCGDLGQLWEALAELWEALGELWEGLYIEKFPINRTSGRYVTSCAHRRIFPCVLFLFGH